jgi:hypothetical protein
VHDAVIARLPEGASAVIEIPPEGISQNALCPLHVAGRQVRLEVVNPETLEVIDRAVLR